jgi:hypothetical protein
VAANVVPAVEGKEGRLSVMMENSRVVSCLHSCAALAGMVQLQAAGKQAPAQVLCVAVAMLHVTQACLWHNRWSKTVAHAGGASPMLANTGCCCILFKACLHRRPPVVCWLQVGCLLPRLNFVLSPCCRKRRGSTAAAFRFARALR